MNLSYGPGSFKKDKVCMEIQSLYTQTIAWSPSGTGVQGTFQNTIGDTLTVTVTPAAGGTLTTAGFSFTFGGAAATYQTTVTFSRKYSGSVLMNLTSLDNNSGTGVDKLCNATIGNPDTLSFDTEVVGNCLQAVFNSNPATVKQIGWSEVDQLTSFSFNYTRSNIGSTTTASFTLTEKILTQWDKDNTSNPISWTDPVTTTKYTTLPAGVKEVICLEDERVAVYSKELCYKVTSPIAFSMTAGNAEPDDAYLGIRPRTDGIPFLPYSPAANNFYEFDTTGKFLYTLVKNSFTINTYSGFTQISSVTQALNFTGFAAAAGYTAVGLAVHPVTGVVYVMYMDGARRLWLATIINNIVNLVGDTQFTSAVTAIIDAHDITFTNSLQLVMAHGSTLYFVDYTTGVINPVTPIPLVGAANNTFGIKSITRYSNGDLMLSGQDSVLGNFTVIYDGESYTKIRHWANNNSLTPPNNSLIIAYPQSPEVRFNRLYVKNLESNQLSIDDRDLVTGLPITIPQNATIKDCASSTSKPVSWTTDICYVIDKNVTSQGMIELNAAGSITSIAPCTTVAGFISPVATLFTSITHDTLGTTLFGATTANNLITYNWAIIGAPALSSTVAITGFAIAGETIKSLRTRWSDNSLWLMTEQTVGTILTYRFYIVNKATAILTLQGSVSYPTASLMNNGSFTWGVDDNIYFTAQNTAGVWRVSILSKVSYAIVSYITDVNYTVDNINTDLPNQRLILTKSGAVGVDFFSYAGQLLSTCAIAAAPDAIFAPLGTFQVGDTVYKVKKVFIKDLNTGAVSAYFQDNNTGMDIQLPALARIVTCDTSVIAVAGKTPKFKLLNGLTTWSRLIDAPDSVSITLTRLANSVIINDGVTSGSPFTINAAFSNTWSSDKLIGNLTFTGGAAGSQYFVAWL